MKHKKTEQATKKQAHKARLQEAKIRRAAPDLALPAPTRLERQRFLIVCEGKNTEPDYFYCFRQYFRVTAAEIIAIGGAGETIRVVERAKKEREKSHFDQVWVVFDKDDFPATHFEKAIHMAEKSEIYPAYSNQSFEYWLLLHFEDHQGGAMHRDQYGYKLNQYLAPFNMVFDTNGSKQISLGLFQLLAGSDTKNGKKRIDLAIERAEKIMDFHMDSTPANAESSTTVFKLVRELLKFI